MCSVFLRRQSERPHGPDRHGKLIPPLGGSTLSCSLSHSRSPSVAPVCQVVAMYDYQAANEDEISFSSSKLINVLDKSNPDWWKGEIDGVTGLFPTNYVRMTTDSDPSQQCKSQVKNRKYNPTKCTDFSLKSLCEESQFKR